MPKMMGIELDLVISKESGDITEKELDLFYDDVIELVEKYQWHCGGGINLIDVNEDNGRINEV